MTPRGTLRPPPPRCTEVNQSNVTQVGGAVLVEIDKGAELALYDALPERWKRLIDSLPVLQRVATVREYLDRLGDDAGYARVVGVFRAKFPGWSPPERTERNVSVPTRAAGRRPRGTITVPTHEGE
jgi:hypothetical protein